MNKIKANTEKRNQRTNNIDQLSTLKMATLINSEYKIVSKAVKAELKIIAKLIDACVAVIKNKGRIFYIGAGTSGRLGVLDASEIYPTFGEKNLFIGIIAGGDEALRNSIENAEDSTSAAKNDLKEFKFSKKDLLIGLAASGRTPYVLSALKYANKIGAITGAISATKDAIISSEAKYAIEVKIGQEPITGSTRMKSGTAQKEVLNIISTCSMVKIGKVYSNIMVDLKPTNKKLVLRAISFIEEITSCSTQMAEKTFKKSKGSIKLATIMIVKNVNLAQASKILNNSNDILANALK